jgi:hypothetical protein
VFDKDSLERTLRFGSYDCEPFAAVRGDHAIRVADGTFDRRLSEGRALEAVEKGVRLRRVEPNRHFDAASSKRTHEECANLAEPRPFAARSERSCRSAVDIEGESHGARRNIERVFAHAHLAAERVDPRREAADGIRQTLPGEPAKRNAKRRCPRKHTAA